MCRSLLAIRLLVLSITFAFRSREVRRLLLDLDPYGDTDPLDMFPLFLKKTADALAPRLIVFRRFVCMFTFPACRDRSMPPNSERSTVLLRCQLPTDFGYISIVYGIGASGVGLSLTIYRMQ